MPTLQQLRYLVALSDLGHFRRAAERCHVTQPTLSAQLKALEVKLGATLVERSSAQIILTPLGQEVVEHARQALREVEDIQSLATLSRGTLQSTIKIGTLPSLGPYLLPQIVPDLHKNHPDLKLYVREGMPKPLLDTLATGGLDALFLPLPVRESEFETMPLFRETLHVVVPGDHAFAQQKKIAPALLEGQTILSLEPGQQLYELVSRLCEQYGAHLSHDFEGTSLDTLRQMVAMGMGLSLLPALYVKSEVAHQDIVVARPFAGTAPSRTIGLVWRNKSAREAELMELSNKICAILKARVPEVTVLA